MSAMSGGESLAMGPGRGHLSNKIICHTTTTPRRDEEEKKREIERRREREDDSSLAAAYLIGCFIASTIRVVRSVSESEISKSVRRAANGLV